MRRDGVDDTVRLAVFFARSAPSGGGLHLVVHRLPDVVPARRFAILTLRPGSDAIARRKATSWSGCKFLSQVKFA